jgi:uncharacterized membrane protein YhaH (DUF805 family)
MPPLPPPPATAWPPPDDATRQFDRRIEPMSPWAMAFSLRGRVGRGAYWRWAVLAMMAGGLTGYALLTIAGMSRDRAETLVTALLLWPSVAVTVKRWHDRDHSGWWVLVNLVPVIGPLWTVYQCGLRRGTPGPNRFGDAPLAPADVSTGR